MERFKTRIKNILKIIGFALVIVLCIYFIMKILCYRDETYSKEVFEDFYKLDKDTVDAIWIGASPIQTSVNPAEIFHESGISTYGLATSSQPICLAPYLIEEAKKTQSPKVFLVDIRMLAYTSDLAFEPVVSEKYTRHVTDCLKPSINRIRAINHMIGELELLEPGSEINKLDYYFRLGVYHTRWKEGISLFFNEDDENSFMGSYAYTGVIPIDKEESLQRIDKGYGELTGYNQKYLEELLDYCDKSGENIVFTLTPCCVDQEYFDRYATIKKTINERGYEVIDFNYMVDDMGLDYSEDFSEFMHFNYKGSKKFSDYVAKYLKNRLKLRDHSEDDGYKIYKNEYEEYKHFLENIE